MDIFAAIAKTIPKTPPAIAMNKSHEIIALSKTSLFLISKSNQVAIAINARLRKITQANFRNFIVSPHNTVRSRRRFHASKVRRIKEAFVFRKDREPITEASPMTEPDLPSISARGGGNLDFTRIRLVLFDRLPAKTTGSPNNRHEPLLYAVVISGGAQSLAPCMTAICGLGRPRSTPLLRGAAFRWCSVVVDVELRRGSYSVIEQTLPGSRTLFCAMPYRFSPIVNGTILQHCERVHFWPIPAGCECRRSTQPGRWTKCHLIGGFQAPTAIRARGGEWQLPRWKRRSSDSGGVEPNDRSRAGWCVN
jgi:hypothetical protein